MQLTPKGAHAAQMDLPSRRQLADDLINGRKNIFDYLAGGVCHDAVAYIRFLLGAKIAPNDLLDFCGRDWVNFFNFKGGQAWLGGSIPAGTAIGFERINYLPCFPSVFHSCISVGNTDIKAINGGLLGAGWVDQRDLRTTLGIPDDQGTFAYDGARIRVWLSNL